jgi:hypothetical protein
MTETQQQVMDERRTVAQLRPGTYVLLHLIRVLMYVLREQLVTIKIVQLTQLYESLSVVTRRKLELRNVMMGIQWMGMDEQQIVVQ